MLIRALGLALLTSLYFSPVNGDTECPMNLDFSKRFLASDDSVRLCDTYSNTVLLIVNTASYCGFTSQFEGLEALQEKYSRQGFSVLGSRLMIFSRIHARRKRYVSFATSPMR